MAAKELSSVELEDAAWLWYDRWIEWPTMPFVASIFNR